MFVPDRAEETLSCMNSMMFLIKSDNARPRQNAPELAAVLVALQTEFLSRIDGDELHRRLLVQREALKVSPRAFFFLIVREAFHAIKYTA